jgi:hypothetical protein
VWLPTFSVSIVVPLPKAIIFPSDTEATLLSSMLQTGTLPVDKNTVEYVYVTASPTFIVTSSMGTPLKVMRSSALSMGVDDGIGEAVGPVVADGSGAAVTPAVADGDGAGEAGCCVASEDDSVPAFQPVINQRLPYSETLNVTGIVAAAPPLSTSVLVSSTIFPVTE